MVAMKSTRSDFSFRAMSLYSSVPNRPKHTAGLQACTTIFVNGQQSSVGLG
jgi:hypothetical protein